MIDPAISAVVRSGYAIRRFFVFYSIALVATLLLSIVLGAVLEAAPLAREALTSFLGNLAAAIAVVMGTYGFYLLITPPGLRNAQVLALRSAEIVGEIVDLQAKASDYWFWGRSGSYLRTVVLPKLNEISAKDRTHIRVRIVIPDPSVAGNTTRYAAIKRSLGEAADDNTLASNVAATVVAAVFACAKNPYLQAEIALCATVPVVRYDISTTGALLTRDAKKLPAILINAGNPYFEMMRDAVENEFQQSRRIAWKALAADGDTPSVEAVLSALTNFPSISAEAISEAKSLVASGSHRYA